MSYKNIFKWIPPYLAVWAGLFLFHNAWFALFCFHIAILFVLIFFQPNISLTLLFKSRDAKRILFNILLCGLSGFVIYFLYPYFGSTGELKTQLAELGLYPATLPAFIAYFSLINPFIEEYFWRVFLGSDAKGFYIGDLVYAGYHAVVLINQVPLLITLFAVVCLTFIGWFWRQTKREDNGLLAPLVGHMAADFSILTAVYLIIK